MFKILFLYLLNVLYDKLKGYYFNFGHTVYSILGDMMILILICPYISYVAEQKKSPPYLSLICFWLVYDLVSVRKLNSTHIISTKHFLIINIDDFIRDTVYDCLKRILPLSHQDNPKSRNRRCQSTNDDTTSRFRTTDDSHCSLG